MRHLRVDYSSIQPWPTKRPHTVKQDGETVFDAPIYRGTPPYGPIIPDDEPVFLLRASDTFAPDIVREWARQLDMQGPHDRYEGYGNPRKWCDVCEQVARVYEWADEMEAYAAEHYDEGKIPDTPREYL